MSGVERCSKCNGLFLSPQADDGREDIFRLRRHVVGLFPTDSDSSIADLIKEAVPLEDFDWSFCFCDRPLTDKTSDEIDQ
ncbi:MAG: hypothetical protein ACKOE2_06275 [Actinomycetales bacterium]